MPPFLKAETNVSDQLLEFLNNCHSNINLTCKITPKKFLDTKIYCNNSSIITKMHRKVRKIILHWFSSIPSRYKRNENHRDLGRAERISSDFNNAKMLTHQKFHNAGYPSSFTNSAIRDYQHKQNKKQDQEDEYIISPNLLEIIDIAGVSIYPA